MKKMIKKNLIRITQRAGIYAFLREWKDKRWVNQILKDLKLKEIPDIYIDPVIQEINLNANDICNSRCVMCNIWRQSKEYEISPLDLENILKDPLYKNVRHIGVTGGEPTLRKDLPQLYEAIFRALPNIGAVSTITNCINTEDVISRIDEVIEVCNQHNKVFSMMISLDGIGNVHENVRRRKGNFNSAISVLNYFKNKGISIATGTTISKVNVWDVDEILDYLKENNLYGRFRVAEFIKRLYNSENKDVIRNFDEDETYHLILFFYKLIFRFETNETFKRTYKSIINVLSGGERLIGCPYHVRGLVLNSKAEIAYCAPKSEVLGNALNTSSYKLYKDNLKEKKRILDNECKNCIHDYHAPITYKEKMIELNEAHWKRTINLSTIEKQESTIKNIKAYNAGTTQILITGWYGTETVGDKAILGQIINDFYEKYGQDIKIIITSLFPIITKRTLQELNFSSIEIVSVYSERFIAAIKGSDVIIMGGGPLMDLEELAIPLTAFKLGKKLGKQNIIYGCGLGPLNSDRYINAVKEILNLSDVIQLRDKHSIALAKQWLSKPIDVIFIGDPAKRYLEAYLTDLPIKPAKKILTCYLREWGHEYAKNLSLEDFEILKLKFEKNLASFIKKKAKEIRADEILLDHMHNFTYGDDDRDFSRKFIREHFKDSEISIVYNKRLSTVDSVVKSMQESSFNICMRFHSVLFAQTLGTNFIAVDYTQGGKISHYLKENNSFENLISINEIVNNEP